MSSVGSIGVTSATLGFEDFIKEYNITYRRQTAGELKDLATCSINIT
jgi:ClpP class serine protease